MRWMVVCVGLVCSGCISVAAYPEQWSPVATAEDGCPDISGVYADVGSSAANLERPGRTATPRLSSHFFPIAYGVPVGTLPRIVRTAVSHPDPETIHVEVTDSLDQVTGRTLVLDIDFECRKGKVWMKESDTSGGEVLLSTRSRIGLARTEAGSLVGESRVKEVGVAYLVPMFASEKNYMLWEQTNWRNEP